MHLGTEIIYKSVLSEMRHSKIWQRVPAAYYFYYKNINL